MDCDPKDFLAQLRDALDALDAPRVSELCSALTDHVAVEPEAYPLQPARRVLEALRAHRKFALMQEVAVAFIQTGRDDPVIRRLHAQALLDQADVEAARAVLVEIVAVTATGSAEHAEARGLLGRAYKQMYITASNGPLARRKRFLELAIDAYRGEYAESGNRWHGINAVALLERARRDRLALDSDPHPAASARALAEEILDAIEELAVRDTWDHGTALEASVALGRTDEALAWFDDYVRGADAFAVASLLRQLTEVWALDPGSEPGSHLIPLLQAEQLLREGGPEILVAPDQLGPGTAAARVVDDPGYQKVLGDERIKNVRWLLRGFERCRSVARVEARDSGAVGTAFLIEGTPLADWLPAVVLVTNAHVVSDTTELEPGQAVVSFREPDREVSRHDVRLLWSSPPDELDVSILEVVGDGPAAPCLPIARNRPLIGLGYSPRTYIIGHAGGSEDLMLSLSDNKILAANATKVHYRTPTLEGSSGSPVFNAAWELIAVHHAGDEHRRRLDGEGTYPANEGIWFDTIAAALSGARDR